jgi:hypothetical protein
MKNNLLFIALFGVIYVNLYADYEQLKAYKRAVKTQINIKKSPSFQADSSYFVIDFKDINKMNTFKLEKKYGLQLFQCIADGICIFKFINSPTQHLQSKKIIQEESNIQTIKLYKAYDFKAF